MGEISHKKKMSNHFLFFWRIMTIFENDIFSSRQLPAVPVFFRFKTPVALLGNPCCLLLPRERVAETQEKNDPKKCTTARATTKQLTDKT
jgi:hypothetical protein